PWAGSTELRAPEVPAASELAAALHPSVGSTPAPAQPEVAKVQVKEAGVPEGSTPTPPSVAIVYRPKVKTVVVEVPRPLRPATPPAAGPADRAQQQPEAAARGAVEHAVPTSGPRAARVAWTRVMEASVSQWPRRPSSSGW